MGGQDVRVDKSLGIDHPNLRRRIARGEKLHANASPAVPAIGLPHLRYYDPLGRGDRLRCGSPFLPNAKAGRIATATAAFHDNRNRNPINPPRW
jgi:hypothetical protein